ncbi:MAG: hypothetical protein E7631_09895 [Ruminococcaceae bacterium]|nr:hypothetical protein [Oscillospiraceae bacterium]
MLIRQQAFGGQEKMLKGNLHCHTARSDGDFSAEEVIKNYVDGGFDFLCLSDHYIYNYDNFGNQPITIIPGMEYDCDDQEEWGAPIHSFHIVCIGPSEKDGNGFRQDEVTPAGKAKTQEELQPYLDDIHRKKNLTILAHPHWSSTPTREIENIQGLTAMEIWNSGAAYWHDMDTDAIYWDELLTRGHRIYGVATDDAHGNPVFCKGWIRVRAENNINSILEAIREGRFYSSCGPEIYDFYVEDNYAVLECSPVAKIRMHRNLHPNYLERKEGITSVRFHLGKCPETIRYIRMSVVDAEGRCAWTNPIWLND